MNKGKGRIADMRVIEDGVQRIISVTVPKGTLPGDTAKLSDSLTGMIQRLTGCPCLSGLDIRIREDLVLNEVVRFDLEANAVIKA